MKLIERPQYMEKMISVMGTPDIKVITGVRRSGKSKPANNLSSFFSKIFSVLGRHIKASHPVHCTKLASKCNNELVKPRIRSVIISQGQATFGRAFGILDKCCQL